MKNNKLIKILAKVKDSFPGLTFKDSPTWKNPMKQAAKAERKRLKKLGLYNKKEFEEKYGKIEEML